MNRAERIRSMSRKEIIEAMYQKQLSFSDEVQRVIYSAECDMRYVILKDSRGMLYYVFERILPWSDDDLEYIAHTSDPLPAEWAQWTDKQSQSFFSEMAEIIAELKTEPIYKEYFRESETTNDTLGNHF